MAYAASYTGFGKANMFEDIVAAVGMFKAIFVGLLLIFFLAYYALFYYFHFGLVLFGTYYYIYYIVVSAAALSALASLSITVGLYSRRLQSAVKKTAIKSNAGIYAFVVSLIPSTMCCTPVIPSVLVAVFGSGGIALASGAVQGFLSSFSPAFIVLAALLMAFSVRSSLARCRKQSCNC
ncbi:MAG: hypothetical protein LVQ97_01160 [Candidatus Micrarchaeales archaeon]|jgi:hypothetical protein|uniref:Uncharacterized protein n=1 Tax=Candidatus Micrarchaeum acidiphilum ARMAN-2 TaxID=425595 RepID=C7DHV7_MICA2|nr:MAG: hypothetical protein UNLARM2_0647 [Candidatus Micrarchaeum acidiphilum ARMAN-2]MCW6160778.1 hypothetical protein [Candidatus Micrarchaeales archaeon]